MALSWQPGTRASTRRPHPDGPLAPSRSAASPSRPLQSHRFLPPRNPQAAGTGTCSHPQAHAPPHRPRARSRARAGLSARGLRRREFRCRAERLSGGTGDPAPRSTGPLAVSRPHAASRGQGRVTPPAPPAPPSPLPAPPPCSVLGFQLRDQAFKDEADGPQTLFLKDEFH